MSYRVEGDEDSRCQLLKQGGPQGAAYAARQHGQGALVQVHNRVVGAVVVVDHLHKNAGGVWFQRTAQPWPGRRHALATYRVRVEANNKVVAVLLGLLQCLDMPEVKQVKRPWAMVFYILGVVARRLSKGGGHKGEKAAPPAVLTCHVTDDVALLGLLFGGKLKNALRWPKCVGGLVSMQKASSGGTTRGNGDVPLARLTRSKQHMRTCDVGRNLDPVV